MIIILVASYIIGSVPWGLIVTKIAGLEDIRKIGSGNIGATNVLRTGKKLVAVLTLTLDIAKGMLPILLAQKYGSNIYVAGILAVIGHVFPIWLKFQGGKGVATGLGVMIMLNWKVAVIFLLTWLIIFKIYRYSSLSSIVAIIASICASLVNFHSAEWECYTIAILGIIIIFKHKQNIIRLIKRQEAETLTTTL